PSASLPALLSPTRPSFAGRHYRLLPSGVPYPFFGIAGSAVLGHAAPGLHADGSRTGGHGVGIVVRNSFAARRVLHRSVDASATPSSRRRRSLSRRYGCLCLVYRSRGRGT